jgi:hypothetical protein
MSIEWTRVTSRAHHGMRGFIASHWVGTVDGRTVFRIEQRKPISAGRHNTRVALLFRMPSGHIGTFNNVAEAKAYAKLMRSSKRLRSRAPTPSRLTALCRAPRLTNASSIALIM